MEPLDLNYRKNFWNNAAEGNNNNFAEPVVFADPINIDEFAKYIEIDTNILDFGCGYGRITNALYQAGFKNVKGIDIADKMLERGKRAFPHLQNCFYLYDEKHLPFNDNSFGAITAFTVFNTIADDKILTNIIKELKRVLKYPGIIYLYEFMIAPFARDIKRYEDFQTTNPNIPYGTFRHKSGSIMRHFTRDFIENKLLSDFEVLWHDNFKFKSMSGKPAIQNQWIARIKEKSNEKFDANIS